MTVIYLNAEQLDAYMKEIDRLSAIIANRDSKLREWQARADAYDSSVGTMIKIITDELLEDHG